MEQQTILSLTSVHRHHTLAFILTFVSCVQGLLVLLAVSLKVCRNDPFRGHLIIRYMLKDKLTNLFCTFSLKYIIITGYAVPSSEHYQFFHPPVEVIFVKSVRKANKRPKGFKSGTYLSSAFLQ